MKINIIKKPADQYHYTINPTPTNEHDVRYARCATVNNAICMGFLLGLPVVVALAAKIFMGDKK